MDCKDWLPDYVRQTYNCEIIFDQPDLKAQINMPDFVTRMIVPKFWGYILIGKYDTRDYIKDIIKKLFIANTRLSDQCPICFNDSGAKLVCDSCLNAMCISCHTQLYLNNQGKVICPFCRSVKGDKRSDYVSFIDVCNVFYIKNDD